MKLRSEKTNSNFIVGYKEFINSVNSRSTGRPTSQLVYNTAECYETTSLSQTTTREGVTTLARHNAALPPTLVPPNDDPLFGQRKKRDNTDLLNTRPRRHG